jgi:hypothetical protein
LKEPEEVDSPLRLPTIQLEDLIDKLISKVSIICRSLCRNKGITSQRLIDEQGKLAIAMANIAIVNNNEVVPHNLQEVLNYLSHGKE